MTAELQESAWQEVLQKLQEIEPDLLDRTETPAHFSDETSNEELLAALGKELASVREEAAERLGQRGVSSALNPLKQLAASDESSAVRQKAGLSVLQLGGEELLAEVAKNLRDNDPQVVAHAAVTLGKVGNPVVLPNLLAAFQTEDSTVGAAIAWALGRLKDPRAIEWLGTALENGFVSPNAAEALGEIGTAEVVPLLLQTLEHPNMDARAYAARSLGRLEQPASLKGIRAHMWLQTREDILQALTDALGNELNSRKVKIACAVALYEQGDKQGGQELLNLLK